MYPIPYELYEKYSIRKYGFHGTSHRYVSGKLSRHLGKPLDGLKVITVHLGNGSSIAAIESGKCVDTTMGFTPLDGLIMGTRSGSIDPSIVTFLQEKEGLDAKGMNDLLNKKSGYLGVSGVTSDQRDLVAAANGGNERAKLALNIQRYQIKKYIGSYAAAMGGLDYVIFTGGIGENSPETRTVVCDGLDFMGITLDEHANQKTVAILGDVTTADSKVKVYIVPTNEELLIARDTKELIGK
jgi:acetate kinase